MSFERRWAPHQWDYNTANDKGDVAPHLPPWDISLKMIELSFCFRRAWRGFVELEGYGRLRKRPHRFTIETLAYACLRGLNVRETLYLFGKEGYVQNVVGSGHPVRQLEILTGQGYGNNLMGQFVSFSNDTNPLVAKAA